MSLWREVFVYSCLGTVFQLWEKRNKMIKDLAWNLLQKMILVWNCKIEGKILRVSLHYILRETILGCNKRNIPKNMYINICRKKMNLVSAVLEKLFIAILLISGKLWWLHFRHRWLLTKFVFILYSLLLSLYGV